MILFTQGELLNYLALESIDSVFQHHGPLLVARLVKNLPAMQDTWVRSLGQEDPLEKGMATHSSTLAWRIPWTECEAVP